MSTFVGRSPVNTKTHPLGTDSTLCIADETGIRLRVGPTAYQVSEGYVNTSSELSRRGSNINNDAEFPEHVVLEICVLACPPCDGVCVIVLTLSPR
ncbi:hypothetical protein J6590_040775 [Homalodisca vitripennis]|nr:hypothetical protein J6590_040775 [Homalodisca vitripennis]